MKRATFMKGLIMTMALSCLSTLIWAQASPAATATGTAGGANITIKYSSPSVKGRVIWGGLVPYDKVWRAGANTATTFETDKEIKVEGKALPAGKYSVYALPTANDCTIIFNSATGQWGINRDGTTTADATKDVLRVTVKPKKSETMNERLAYTINPKGFVLSWENLDIPVSIK